MLSRIAECHEDRVAFASKYAYIVIPCEEGGYAACVPDLCGCMTQSETIEELHTNVQDAIWTWMDDAMLHDEDIPSPSFGVITWVTKRYKF